jgi:hypothetical protein
VEDAKDQTTSLRNVRLFGLWAAPKVGGGDAELGGTPPGQGSSSGGCVREQLQADHPGREPVFRAQDDRLVPNYQAISGSSSSWTRFFAQPLQVPLLRFVFGLNQPAYGRRRHFFQRLLGVPNFLERGFDGAGRATEPGQEFRVRPVLAISRLAASISRWGYAARRNGLATDETRMERGNREKGPKMGLSGSFALPGSTGCLNADGPYERPPSDGWAPCRPCCRAAPGDGHTPARSCQRLQ